MSARKATTKAEAKRIYGGRGRPPTGRAARSQIVWPPELLARARWAAEHQGLSLSEYVRWCVVADLEEFTSRDQSGTAKTDAEG